MDVIYALADFPFVFNPEKEKQVQSSIVPLIHTLEQILECMIMYDYQDPAATRTSFKATEVINTAGKQRKISITLTDFENEDGNY